MPIPEYDLEATARLFKVLSDPHRLAIVAMLASATEPVCVCDFTAALPVNQPAVSHHLKVLRNAGLVAGKRRGTWVFYGLEPGTRMRLRGAVAGLLGRQEGLPHYAS